jgi:hypothetical protein
VTSPLIRFAVSRGPHGLFQRIVANKTFLTYLYQVSEKLFLRPADERLI